MHRRSFFTLISLVPLTIAARAATQDDTPKPDPLPVEPWLDGPDTLERWRRAQRQPVWESDVPELALLISCLRSSERVEFAYSSGSTPGQLRCVTPGQLYKVEGFPGYYLSGYCHLREAERTFLVARMSRLASSDSEDTQIIYTTQTSH